ncbi:WYL domain-containing protein, partial [Streptomonospora algeriensis]
PAREVEPVVERWATVEDVGGGCCRVVVHADDLDWPALALLGTGAEFDAVEPQEFRDRLRAVAERFLRAADHGG